MTKSNQKELIEFWQQEEQQPFTGWDFSYLDNRMIEGQPDWSYSSMAAELMRDATAVLDMGTGGGERFLQLRAHWPKTVVVSEEYPPNFKLAQERLAPLGVKVVDVRLTDHDPMPFDNNEFDLVINRHSAFNTDEVARILSPGGTFFTQQVHGLWAQDLLAAFGAKPQWPEATPAYNSERLKNSGLALEMVEAWQGKLAFTDVGAIVYFLKAVPWTVPGFSVETHLDNLLRLQSQLDSGQELVFEARKYLIEAYKKS